MWISLSRQQNRGRRDLQMPSAARSSIPPPGPPARPERSKSNDSKDTERPAQKFPSSREKSAGEIHPTAPPLPEKIATEIQQRSPLHGVRTAWGPPGHHTQSLGLPGYEPQGSPRGNPNGPARKSFRLTGHSHDLSLERNMLPLWLEEETREDGRQIGRSPKREAVVQDISFESRWDSMRERSKRQPPIVTVRPPGWEDVGQQGKQKKKKSCKSKSNFCPSFTINDIPQHSSEQQASSVGMQPPPIPVMINIEPPPVSSQGPQKHNDLSKSDAFDMTELSENMDNIFVDSFLQQPNHSISTSNLAPQSASNSPSRTPSQTSNTAITDRHLWASTDSFICEDFSFCKGRPPKTPSGDNISSQSPPRSYSQILLRHPEANRNVLPNPDGINMVGTVHLSEEFSHENTRDHEYFETESRSPMSACLESTNGNEAEVGALSLSLTEDVADDSFHLPETLDEVIPIDDKVHTDISSPTLRMTDNLVRQNWISFDNGSSEHFNEMSSGTTNCNISNSLPQDDKFDFIHQSNFRMYRRQSFENAISPTSPTSPVLSRNLSGSTLNLVEPRLEQTSETYKGEFVRSYSIRGRRASKRVTRTVNQKMKPPEYGKLVEPVRPMYSKAALTMASGSGLFEQDSPTEDIVQYSEVNARIQGRENEMKFESHTATENISQMNDQKRSSLTPGLPNRAGSLRVPRLPTLFLRRSLSLNTPKVSKGEVPFHRLPDRRGSFRKAMSGIGAIARNIRRRSGNLQTSVSASSHITENPSGSEPLSRLQRSASFNRQIPKAPRLPRRAISHKHTTSGET